MITFVAGRDIYTMTDDGKDIQCLTTSSENHGMIFNIAWSPDGKELGFTVQQEPLSPYVRVCSLDMDSNKLTYLTPPGQINYFGQWLPDGSILYTEQTIQPGASDQYLCKMRKDGSDPQRVFHCYAYRGVTYLPEMDNYQIGAISADGANIVLLSIKDQQMYMLHEGADPVPVENEGLKVQSIIWAVDGNRFAFSCTRSAASKFHKLHTMHADGTNRKQLGKVVAESGFSWSPDGQKIAFIGTDKYGFTINTVEVDSGKSAKITSIDLDPNSGDMPGAPEWSPDSRYLLYSTYIQPYLHIYRADLATQKTDLLVGEERAFQYISNLIWR